MKRNVFRFVAVIVFGLAIAAPQASAQMVLGGAEGDSHLFFFDGASPYGQSFWWDDSEARFHLTTNLKIDGTQICFGSVECWRDGGSNLISANFDLSIDGTSLFINGNGPEASSALFFYEGGSSSGESLLWDDSAHMFVLSDDFVAAGVVATNTGNMRVNFDGPDGNSALYFWEGNSSIGRFLQWDDAENRFEMNDTLMVSGNIVVDTVADVGFNAFYISAPFSGDITHSSDILVEDLEVQGQTYLDAYLWMKGRDSTGNDGDQTIYFYDNDNRSGEYIRWDDSEDGFRITNHLYLGTEASDTTYSIRNNGDLAFHHDFDSDQTSSWFRVFNSGFTYESLRIYDGDEAAARFDGTVYSNGIDYAEAFRVDDQTLEAGDVVVLRFDKPEYIGRSTSAGESHLVGVISDNAGFVTGKSFNAEEAADAEIAKARVAARVAGDYETEKALTSELMYKVEQQYRDVALAGRVPVKVDASFGAIRAGDYLTSSPTPGHAMALTEPGHAIGIAIDPWSNGPGKVLAFIQPRWYGGPSTRVPSTRGVEDLADSDTAAEERGALVTETAFDRDSGSLPAVGVDPGMLHVLGESLAGFQPVIEAVEVGDVLVADRTYEGWMRRSEMAADAAVVGVVTETDGVVLGAGLERFAELDQQRFEDSFAPVAMSGIVRCKVDASYAAIGVGDLLSTSPTPGHAMRAESATPGTILGKALESMDNGTGTIRVLVMLR
jgi:hypothetical protein